jgi:cysteinyl-tRNA synthetase
LNSAGAVAELHKLAGSGDAAGLLASAQFLGLLTPELGAWADAPAEGEDVLGAIAERMTAVRADAMARKDFSEVDRMKAVLLAAGVEVRMSKEGVTLEAKPEFDAAKLADL